MPERPAGDPLAADKRTLIIALVAMIGLVGVGIVSAALFTGSACQDIAPSPVATAGDPATGEIPVDALLAELEPGVATAVDTQLTELAEQLGAVTGIAVVDGAAQLAVTSDGVAATGPITSLLPASGGEVTAAADVGSGVVVGSGDALMSLARVNDLTGQVDAFASIDTTGPEGLSEIGCVDTATVGTPLAFELDAADGQLMLFRADEDGDDAELELRDPREGRLWFTRVDVGVAPPGVTGERIDGRLGEDLAIVVRRTAPGEDVPLVTALDRGDGAEAWQIGREDLTGVPDVADGNGSSVVRDDAPQRLEVLALDDEQVLIAITDARDEDAVVAGGTDALGPSTGPGHVVALDVRDGSPRWQRPLTAGVRVLAADATGSGLWLVVEDGDQAQLLGFDPAGAPLGEAPDGVVASVDAESASASVTGQPSSEATAQTAAVTVAVLGGQLVIARPGSGEIDVEVVDAPDALVPRHVLASGDRVHVLFGWPAGDDPAGAQDPTGAGTGASADDRGAVVTFDIAG